MIVAVVLRCWRRWWSIIVGFGDADGWRPVIGDDVTVGGVLQAAGLLFFAFAGYARIATLGEEVRDPARTIPRAIPIALGHHAGRSTRSSRSRCCAELGSGRAGVGDRAVGRSRWRRGFLRLRTAWSALGRRWRRWARCWRSSSGVSRTTLAMARDRHLPRALAAVHPRFGSPHRAEVVVGVVVAVVAAVVDVRGAIGFSSFAVLLYYAIANASALTLGAKVLPAAGLAGCLLLAFLLPLTSVLVGAGVVAVGALAYWASRHFR